MVSRRLDIVTQPDGEISFADVASGDAEHGQNTVSIVRNQYKTVASQKQLHSDEGRAFAAIYERMVAGDAKSIRSRKFGSVRRAVVRKLLRARSCRREAIDVTNAR